LLDRLKAGGLGPDKLAVEGVTYGAGVMTNIVSPGGADGDGVKDAARLFALAASKCPETVIIGGGYSQGAAIMHRAAKGLPKNVEDRIAGIALFGDTQNYQSKGHIVGFPSEKSKVFCQDGDGVCNGLLNVNFGHLAYSAVGWDGKYNNPKLLEGAAWLISQVKAFQSSASSASSEAAPAAGTTPAKAPKGAAKGAPKGKGTF
jgi:cutinase